MTERSGIVSMHEVPQEEWQEGRFGGRDQDLGRAAGSVRVGLRREVISPGKQSGPRHAHMSEEEMYRGAPGPGNAPAGRGARGGGTG
jgi:uncharacterized cupin superfamily protein